MFSTLEATWMWSGHHCHLPLLTLPRAIAVGKTTSRSNQCFDAFGGFTCSSLTMKIYMTMLQTEGLNEHQFDRYHPHVNPVLVSLNILNMIKKSGCTRRHLYLYVCLYFLEIIVYGVFDDLAACNQNLLWYSDPEANSHEIFEQKRWTRPPPQAPNQRQGTETQKRQALGILWGEHLGQMAERCWYTCVSLQLLFDICLRSWKYTVLINGDKWMHMVHVSTGATLSKGQSINSHYQIPTKDNKRPMFFLLVQWCSLDKHKSEKQNVMMLCPHGWATSFGHFLIRILHYV